jgi:SAM-dependent methyltransferase
MKRLIKRIPIVGPLILRAYRRLPGHSAPRSGPFPGSKEYWEARYASGGDSGTGSHAQLAAFKAEVLNAFVTQHDVRSVIEFGCGDGSQLALASYPRYLGLDVSETVVARCRQLFASDPSKTFALMSDYRGEGAELTLSLDVIYHFDDYMRKLFAASSRYVIVYSSDTDANAAPDADTDYSGAYIRQREFSKWVRLQAPAWTLIEHIPNRYPHKGDDREGSFADFFIYEKR